VPVLTVDQLITGAAAWLLADVRHGRARRVQLDMLGGQRLRLVSDGDISGRPVNPAATLDSLMTQRGWRFSDGRLDWPDILEACADWELVVPRDGAPSLVLEGVGSQVLRRTDASRPEPGARFTFTPDSSRTLGELATPTTLAALHAQALKWPDAKYVVKLPGYDRWLSARPGM
jgi:hypothetical protein